MSNDLSQQILALAVMAMNDGCDPVVVDDLHNVARWLTGGGHRNDFARRRLVAMRTAVAKSFDLVQGSEVHIALACDAYETVHGPLGSL
jgi:hypothetical protein